MGLYQNNRRIPLSSFDNRRPAPQTENRLSFEEPVLIHRQ
jgi:hypothetical protein